MNPKVSLILTTYNCEEYLEQTLENIEKQDYENLEIVIKDGLSTDGTLEIIKRFQESGMPIIWESKKDIGIYDAMNQGYQLSTGDIIAFFNDQFSVDNAITILVNTIREGGENCIGVHANLVYTNGEHIVRYWRMKEGKIKNGWMPGHPTLFLKRSIYEQYGLYKTNYKCSADYEFMVRILKNQENRLAYVDKTLVRMYYGGTSTNSFQSYLVSLKEGQKALEENGYSFTYWIDFQRTVRVLKQFILRKMKYKMEDN